MNRPVIPDYFPPQCMGCETLGMAISRRDEAIDSMGLEPSRRQIMDASRLGEIARELCERARAECPGLAEGCILEDELN